jgi:hypothetical protein
LSASEAYLPSSMKGPEIETQPVVGSSSGVSTSGESRSKMAVVTPAGAYHEQRDKDMSQAGDSSELQC